MYDVLIRVSLGSTFKVKYRQKCAFTETSKLDKSKCVEVLITYSFTTLQYSFKYYEKMLTILYCGRSRACRLCAL